MNKDWISITTKPGTELHTHIKSEKDFKNHIINDTLSNLIEGKKVALVGPSPNLIGLNSGALIDSYDVVIRVNQKFDMDENQKKDYGSKTDILIGSFNENNIKECYNNINHIFKYKIIIGVMPSYKYPPTINFFNYLKENKKDCFILDDGYIYKVFREVGTVVNSGLMSIILLLNYNIRELFITGFTFYNMGNFGKIYYDDYFKSIVKNGNYGIHKQEDYKKRNDFKIHDIKTQINYFKELYKKNKQILKLDNFLEKNI